MKEKKILNRIEENVSMGFIKLICVLNGIDPDDYLRNVGMFSGKMLMKDINFIDMSCIDWNTHRSYNINTTEFKSKFMSILLRKIMGRDGKIIKNIKNRYNIPKKDKSYNLAKDVNFELFKTCYNLTTSIMNHDNNIRQLLFDVNKYAVATTSNNDMNEMSYNIEYLINEIIVNTRYDGFSGRYYDNGTVVYELLRIAYIMITNDMECEDFINGKKFIGLHIEEDLSGYLYKFGKRLRKHIKKNKKSISPLFKAFVDAGPEIGSNSIYADNPDIGLVHLSLLFLKFMINDKRINLFIDNIIINKLKLSKRLPQESPIDIQKFMKLTFG